MIKRLDKAYYMQDVLVVAKDLLGKILVRQNDDGSQQRFRITETEAYRGEEDSACHASKGKTQRTTILYEEGGLAYIYLCYGIHSLLNVVTGDAEKPQAVLIRGVQGYNGPGKLTKAMNIKCSMNYENLETSDRLWIEDDGFKCGYTASKRVGIDYATEPYRSIEWRFAANDINE